MGRRTKWGRRRGDNRVEKKADYALLQNAEQVFDQADIDALDSASDALAIPDFRPENTDPENADKDSDQSSETPPPTTLTRQDNPRIFALVGATGGVGTTCLATQLAHEFAVTHTSHYSNGRGPIDSTVCLIDLDFEAGACAHHLDLLPSLTLEDLCGPAEQIDKAFTQALVSTHECGISLLAAPNKIGANSRVNPHTIMAMLDAAAELFDTVIIDLPKYQQPWTLSVMRAVDILGVTCELTIPSLHAARERLAMLSETTAESVNAHVILNKFEKRSFKNMLRLSDAETALGRSVLTTLCLDPDTTREALNCGEPAGAIRPESRYVKEVRKLAEALRTTQANAIVKAA
jgi:pilus assembly protein CpaE